MQKLGRNSIYYRVQNDYGFDIIVHANKNYGIHRVIVKDHPNWSSALTSRMQGRQINNPVTISHLLFRLEQLNENNR